MNTIKLITSGKAEHSTELTTAEIHACCRWINKHGVISQFSEQDAMTGMRRIYTLLAKIREQG